MTNYLSPGGVFLPVQPTFQVDPVTGTPVGGVPVAPIAGQQAVTASAVALPAAALVNGVVLKSKSTNSGTVWVGGAGVTVTDNGTGNGYALAPGEAVAFAVANLNSLFIIGTAADVVYYAGN